MNQIKFSIITISFNSEKTIERTIKSVLAQTYTNFEYIIVDGESKDSTIDIIRKYEPLFEGRMKWKSETDNGIYDAMNKGIKMASGDIIGIVNSDDWLEQNALETIYNGYLENNKSLESLYCGWIRFHYYNGTEQILKTSHEMLQKYAKRYEMGGIRHPAVFVPKQIYNQYGIFDDRMKVMADTDLILRYFYAGVKFYYPEKVVSNMSDGGVSNSEHIKAYNDYRLILDKYDINKLKYNYLLLYLKIKRILKVLIPSAVLKTYRRLSKA